MRRLRVYIDTSVVGGCLEDVFAEASRKLLEMAEQGEIVLLVSDLLADELLDAPPAVAEVLQLLPAVCVEQIIRSEEAYRLQECYLNAGVVGQSSKDDALHVALATVAAADIIVSWNFKHIVHLDKIRKFNAVNALEGYSQIEIRSPQEIVTW